MSLAPGSRFGPFEVVAALGAGGMGEVYRARDAKLNRDVAIKVPHRQHVATPEDLDAFLSEARVLASLNHPHIVPVHDVGRTAEGLCFVVSQFIEGRDLKKRLQEGRPSFTESAALVELVLKEITDCLERGETVKLSSFGSFVVRKKGQRIGRNPKTGTEVPISPRRVMVFKPSAILKQRINGGSGDGHDDD